MTVSTFAGTALAWALTYAMHSTLLLGLALLAAPALARRGPRLAEIALRGALLGSLLTATVQIGFGVEPWTGSLRLPGAAPAAEVSALPVGPTAALAIVEVVEVVEAAGQPAAAPLFRAEPTALLVPALPIEEAASPAAAFPRLSRLSWPSWSTALFALWAAFAALLLAASARSYHRLVSRVRFRAQVVGGSILQTLERLAAPLGLTRAPRLTCTTRLGVPVAFGSGGRAEIALPPRALFGLSDEQQEGLLAHELAHLVRRDPLWLLAGRLLASVLFFQPLNWIALVRLRELSEVLADEWAVERTGRPLSLARCLTEVAGWSVGPALPVPGMAAGRPSHLGERVRRLLADTRTGENRRRNAWTAAGVLLSLALVAVFAPRVAADPPAPPAAPETSAAAAWPEAPEAPEPSESPEMSDLPEMPEMPEMPEAPEEPGHLQALAELSPETSARLEELEGRMTALGETMGRTADTDELGRLGAEMGQLAAEMSTLFTAEGAEGGAWQEAYTRDLEQLGEKIASEVEKNFGEDFEARFEKMEADFGRDFGENFGKEFGEAFGPEFARRWQEFGLKMAKYGEEIARQMEQSGDSKKLESEIDAMVKRIQPSREEIERLGARARALADEARRDGKVSAEERQKIAEEARKLADAVRPNEAELRALRELARKHREAAGRITPEQRAEIDRMRREAHEMGEGARREARRHLEESRQYRSEMQERTRRDRRDRKERGVAPEAPPPPPAPPTPPRAPRAARPARPAHAPAPVAPARVPAPRAVPAPAPAMAAAVPTPAPAPRAVPAPPALGRTPRAASAPTPASTPRMAPTPRVAPVPRVAPAPGVPVPGRTPRVAPAPPAPAAPPAPTAATPAPAPPAPRQEDAVG